ncbi:hypothetical protein DIE14_12710 [Burkholderia sp. Bp9017]|nr:hypothetical protein DIE14_12710 [Burkholderia sp. Bp9017]RQZ34617.1 hypothetical protein DIE13_13690 [Burkholderia sp. Bp9016]
MPARVIGALDPLQQVEVRVAGECGEGDASEFEQKTTQLGQASIARRSALAHALGRGHDAGVQPVAELAFP